MKFFNSGLCIAGAFCLAASASAQSPSCVLHPRPNENIGAQLAKFRRIETPFVTTALSAREVKLVRKLVEASKYIESIYWRQSDPAALALYNGLAGCSGAADQKLRRFLLINGSR
ncbi:MAG: hypothetical protein ABIZ36_13390, partial [Gemmatimonadaceae bacterium]